MKMNAVKRFACIVSMTTLLFAHPYAAETQEADRDIQASVETDSQSVRGTEILSESELEELEEELKPYYGFFLSEYEDPTEIQWRQVFYNGAGLTRHLTEEQQEHLQAHPNYSGGTDATVIFGSDIREYVKRTTGTNYADAKYPLNWLYVEEDDFYCFSHGDTNGGMPTLNYGEKDGETYYLYYVTTIRVPSEENPEQMNSVYAGCRMTAKKTADGWQFQSNVRTTGTEEEILCLPKYVGAELNETQVAAISPDLKEGQWVRFGHYEQDNDKENGPEEILWRVLEADAGKALLLSEYVLDLQPFSDGPSDANWDECSLRSWLNGTFLGNAFSEEEASKIIPTKHSYTEFEDVDTLVEAESTDQIFLLDERDVERDAVALSDLTAASTYGLYVTTYFTHGDSRSTALCTAGFNAECIKCLYEDGSIGDSRRKTDLQNIRPTMWIRLD